MSKENKLLVLIMTVGVFGILTTELGIIGVLPLVAEHFQVNVSQAGLLVSLFALGVAISAPITPLVFSGMNRKNVMLLVLGIFVITNIISVIATYAANFNVLLFSRIVSALFHPVYCSLALTVAGTSVKKEEAPKAVAKVIMGVTAGMVLGSPITNFIANTVSLEMAMLFFAVVNAMALIATMIFIPSMPVKERLTYGSQLSVLKNPIVWLSIATVIFIQSGYASINSYVAEYLETITDITGSAITFGLLILGLASMVGNLAGGNLLAKNAMKTATFFPIALVMIHLLSFLTGQSSIPMMITLILWGFLFAIGNNISQYWITSVASKAPDFANGLFLACSNLGITIGTTVAGLFISGMGTQYIVLGAILFLIMTFVSVLLRRYIYKK